MRLSRKYFTVDNSDYGSIYRMIPNKHTLVTWLWCDNLKAFSHHRCEPQSPLYTKKEPKSTRMRVTPECIYIVKPFRTSRHNY